MLMPVSTAQPSARCDNESYSKGASRPAATAIMLYCRNIWQDAASSALSGKGCSAWPTSSGIDRAIAIIGAKIR